MHLQIVRVGGRGDYQKEGRGVSEDRKLTTTTILCNFPQNISLNSS